MKIYNNFSEIVKTVDDIVNLKEGLYYFEDECYRIIIKNNNMYITDLDGAMIRDSRKGITEIIIKDFRKLFLKEDLEVVLDILDLKPYDFLKDFYKIFKTYRSNRVKGIFKKDKLHVPIHVYSPFTEFDKVKKMPNLNGLKEHINHYNFMKLIASRQITKVFKDNEELSELQKHIFYKNFIEGFRDCYQFEVLNKETIKVIFDLSVRSEYIVKVHF